MTDGATIQNIHVDGTIITDHKFAGGFIGYAEGVNKDVNHYLINCISSVNIQCGSILHYIDINGNETSTNNGRPYDCTHGGLVGQNEKGVMNFTNCIFDGSITDSKEPKTANKCTGFIAWVNNAVNYTNCIMAGTIDVKPNDDKLKNSMATFHRLDKAAKVTYTENYVSYYINEYTYKGEAKQGVQAPSVVVPANVISRQFLANGKYYYIPGATLNGSTIDFRGWTFSSNTNNIIGGADGINYVYNNSDDTYTTKFVERYDFQTEGEWNEATNWKYDLIPSATIGFLLIN